MTLVFTVGQPVTLPGPHHPSCRCPCARVTPGRVGLITELHPYHTHTGYEPSADPTFPGGRVVVVTTRPLDAGTMANLVIVQYGADDLTLVPA